MKNNNHTLHVYKAQCPTTAFHKKGCERNWKCRSKKKKFFPAESKYDLEMIWTDAFKV